MDSNLSSGLRLISLSNPIETLISPVLNETSSLSVLVRSLVRLFVSCRLWTNRLKDSY